MKRYSKAKNILQAFSWIFIIILAWSIGWSYNIKFGGQYRWVSSIYSQKARIAKQFDSPRRILLVGGSGTHFGLDAQQLEQEMGIPAINMGLHAGLGLDAILGAVSSHIREGDVILLSPEYGLITSPNGNESGRLAGQFGIQIGNFSVGELNPRETVNKVLLSGSPGLPEVSSLLRRIRRSKNSSSYTNSLSTNGDALQLPQGKAAPGTLDAKLSDYALWRINQFKKEVENSGAQLIIGLPWFYTRADKIQMQHLQETVNKLNHIAPVLYNSNDLNLKTDLKLFGDTHYHLSITGRKLRTSEIAKELSRVLLLLSKR